MPALSIRNLTKVFGRTSAVDNLSLDIDDGEMVTILGPSGCGKTTLLRMIAGLETPTAGELVVGGEVVTSTARGLAKAPEKRGMGMVFQSYAIWPNMTVAQNVGFPLKVRKVPRGTIQESVARTLALVGLAGLEERPATLLSGGQQQRVALARALVFDPKVLLLDEPLSNLDLKLRESMRVELKALQRRLGITAIFVTHDQAEAMVLSDRICLMNAGRIEQLGSPRDLYHRPGTRFAMAFLGRTNFLSGTVAEISGDDCFVSASQSGNWTLRCKFQGNAAGKGEAVTLGVRPEHVSLHKESPDRPHAVLEGVLKTAHFMGDHWEYLISSGDQEIWVNLPSTHQFAPGDRVYAQLETEWVRLWAAGG